MQRETLVEALLGHRDAFLANGATSLYLYGSRARGDNGPQSDLDLFIDYQSEVPRLFELVEMEHVLSEQLGVPVSISTRRSLHPKMREGILRDAVRVF